MNKKQSKQKTIKIQFITYLVRRTAYLLWQYA